MSEAKPRIALFSSSNATIASSPPLVTSNKARAKYGLPPLSNSAQSEARFDALRPQRLAHSVTVYVEQHSAHPLESDAAELYGPPDGYLDKEGAFHEAPSSPNDRPVYEIELRPEDGLYPFPYMARQADGRPWERDETDVGAPAHRSRQPFFPDGSRLVEEIDRFGIGEGGVGNLISSRADLDFYRVLPPSGYTKGLSKSGRSDAGEGDIVPEKAGRDFFPYRPWHLGQHPPRPGLARIVNDVLSALEREKYDGIVWLQGSPRIEETLYWLNLLLDTSLPICGNAAQRAHGQIGDDGSKNISDSIEFIKSRVWADEDGRNRLGAVLIQEQQIFAARDVQKGDARPGAYVTTGGHGGIVGAVGFGGLPIITYLPATRHTHRSLVNLSRLPAVVSGVRRDERSGAVTTIETSVRDERGRLLEAAIPRVQIVKDGNYADDSFEPSVQDQVDVLALMDFNLGRGGLSGFVLEGLSPYGTPTSVARHAVLLSAVYSGIPVVRVGRGNNEGFSAPVDMFIGGRNLTSTKARILLMACLMRFGSLPPVANPKAPTAAELNEIRRKLQEYQAVFDTH
jgi:hypothetical protein